MGKLVIQIALSIVILAHGSRLEQATCLIVPRGKHLPALNDLKAEQGRCAVQNHHVHGTLAHSLEVCHNSQAYLQGRLLVGVLEQ